jgi:hypothetical protein
MQNEESVSISDDQPSDVPFESLPLLSSNDVFTRKADRLRELKAIKDSLFDDTKDKSTGLPRGEFDRLKIELGAMVSASGAKSVAYFDLRIRNQAGGETKGKLTGEVVLRALHLSAGISDMEIEDLSVEDLRRVLAVALAAVDINPEILLQHGVHLNFDALRSPGKPRSPSTVVEWIGKRGPGASSKPGSAGGGAVQ